MEYAQVLEKPLSLDTLPPKAEFPDLEMEAESLMSPLLTGRFFTTRATQEDQTPDGASLIF